MFGKNLSLVIVMLGLLVSACSKMEIKKGAPKINGQRGVPASEPTVGSNGAAPQRTFVANVDLDGDFVTAINNQGYYGPIDQEYACAQWVRVQQNGQSVNHLELINSDDCQLRSNTVFNYHTERVKSLVLKQTQYGMFEIYTADGKTRVGEMRANYQGNTSNISGYSIEALCTGSYSYEMSNSGVCILTTDENTGRWDDLYVF